MKLYLEAVEGMISVLLTCGQCVKNSHTSFS